MITAFFLEDPEARIQSPHENLSLHIKNYTCKSSSHGKTFEISLKIYPKGHES